jgi:hypothetical protein
LLELSAKHEREGLGDAPWPPHYRKQPGEPERVQPSRSRQARGRSEGSPTEAPRVGGQAGRRKPKFPLIEIARAQKKEDALAGLERWKSRHQEASKHLEPADVLVDSMRGRFHTWTRIRINLRHVPEALRPPQELLDPDETPNDWDDVNVAEWRRTRPRARKES